MNTVLDPQFAVPYAPHEGATRAAKLFHLAFADKPAGTYRAPGRVNVIGEHTDYNGGVALPLALPHATYAAMRPRSDRRMRVVSAQMSQPIDLDLDELSQSLTDASRDDGSRVFTGPGAYVGGTVLGLEDVLNRVGEFPGFDVAIDSCVPLGAGLSSSAALECAVAVGVDDLLTLGLSDTVAGRHVLLDAGRRAENFYVGAPTGGLDQAAALLCSPGHVILLDCRTLDAEPVEFDLAARGLELLVIDTKAHHDLADGQYAKRRHSCEVAAAALGVEFLGDLLADSGAKASSPAISTGLDSPGGIPRASAVGSPAKFAEILSRLHTALGDSPTAAEVHRCTRHVLTEIQRTRDFVAELRGAWNPEVLGDLMNASHESLRYDYQVTCAELDTAVEAARQAGAYGARMTGGGFGGCAIALVKQEAVEPVAQEVAGTFASAGFDAPAFLLSEPAAAAAAVQVSAPLRVP